LIADGRADRVRRPRNQEQAEQSKPTSFPTAVPAPTATRNDFADYLKGALIFLVACGHLIQYVGCQGDARYYADPLYKAIYTFHMPLFMAVSGYVSFRAIARTGLLDCAWRRARQVIVPAICWPLLYLLARFLIFTWNAGSMTGGGHAFRLYLVHFRPGLWFLWAVFVATVVVSALKQLRLDRLELFAAAGAAFLFAPEGACIYLIKYTFPFFCLGYALAKGDQIRLPAAPPPLLVAAIVAASAGCYLLWTTDTYVYTTRMWPAPANLPNIALRYFAGVVVSAMFVWLLHWIYRRAKSPLLSNWGRQSLAIYIIHFYLVEILAAFVHPAKGSPWFSWLGAPVLAGILCLICYWAGAWLGGIPVLRALLLGRMAQPPSPGHIS
jgi:fucose 4-O-acetylase-like acetyltransferase